MRALSLILPLGLLLFARCGNVGRSTLDTSFGSLGKVTTDFSAKSDVAFAVAIQSDQKIIAAGRSASGSESDFAVTRYNIDGSLDSTFGSGGKVTTDFAGSDEAKAVIVQTDGKIVVAGTSIAGSSATMVLARYDTVGNLDVGFEGDGKVKTLIGSSTDEIAALALQSDGKIVAVGSSKLSTTQIALLRFNTDGSLDTSFGSGGKITTAIGTSEDKARAVGLQANGNIVVTGYTKGANSDFFIARYLTNGTLDTTFGTAGKTVFDFSEASTASGSVDEAVALAVLRDDRILVVGSAREGSSAKHALAKLTAAGAFDTTFAGAGKTTAELRNATTALEASPRGLSVSSDGSLFVGGFTNDKGTVDLALSRYLATGALDSSFGTKGTVTVDFSGQSDEVNAVAAQSDGKLVLAGHTFSTSIDFALIRFIP